MKKHTGLIIGIIVAVLVIAGGAAYVFAGDYIVNSLMLATKSDDEYFRWLSDKHIKKNASYMSLTDTISKLTSSNSETSQGESGKMALTLQVTDEFCDMFDLYSFKDEKLEIDYTSKDGEIGLSITPSYDNKELLTLNVISDLSRERLLAQIPTYREEVIDLSPLYSELAKDNKEIGDALANVQQSLESAKEAGAKSGKEMADIYTKYAKYLTDGIKDVEIEKGEEVKVNGESVKVNNVILTLDAKDLKTQLNGLLDMLKEDGYFSVSDSDFEECKKLVNSIDASAEAEITLNVNKKAQVVGNEIRITYKSTKVSAGFSSYSEDDKEIHEIKVSVNGIKAAEIQIAGKLESREYDYTVTVEPASFIQSLLSQYSGLSLRLELKGNEKAGNSKFILINNSNEIATFSISNETGEYSGPVFDADKLKTYKYDEITSSEYFNATRLVGLALDIVDKINEPFLTNYINQILDSYLGSGYSLDTIREYYETGVFDMFNGGSEESNITDGQGIIADPEPELEPEPEPAAEATIPGIVSPNPEDYVRRTWDMPEASQVYSFSHLYMADYAELGQYKGLSLTLKASGEITTEEFEQKKQEYLSYFTNYYTVPNNGDLTAQMGDEIYFEIVPVVGDYEMSMYRYTDCYALLGAYSYGEGIDDKVVGMKVGDTQLIEATLGDDFGDFSGYTGTFKITLTEICRYVEPAWTEEFICDYLGFESLDECSDYIMSMLESETEISKDSIVSDLLSLAWNNFNIKSIPDSVYSDLRQEAYDSIYDVTVLSNQRPEEYFVSIGYSIDEVAELLDDDVESSITSYCFYAAIAREENITLSGEEVMELVELYMDYFGCSSFDELMESLPLDTIIDYEISERINDLIYESADLNFE